MISFLCVLCCCLHCLVYENNSSRPFIPLFACMFVYHQFFSYFLPLYCRLRSLCRGMVVDLSTMKHIVVRVLVQKRCVWCLLSVMFVCCLFFLPVLYSITSFMQSDDDCCNSCEEVQDAYKKKGWAVTNVDLIDQVSFGSSNSYMVSWRNHTHSLCLMIFFLNKLLELQKLCSFDINMYLTIIYIVLYKFFIHLVCFLLLIYNSTTSKKYML